jgi:Sulfotransferase domain
MSDARRPARTHTERVEDRVGASRLGCRPILVTGMFRSGTTWVGRILAASGEVGYIDEPFNRSATHGGSIRFPVDHWYTYVTAENERRFLPALVPALRFEYPLARQLTRCRNRTHLRETLRSWRGYVRSRGQRPLIKDPNAVFSAEWFMRRLGSDVVVVVREPVAVVGSWKRLGWSFDFTNLLEQAALMRDWLGRFEPQMSAARQAPWGLVDSVALLWHVIYAVVADERFPQVHLVRHEDLSRDPLGEYAKLYDTLGLTFTDTVAEAVLASSSGENPAETRIEKPFDTVLDSKANLENWRYRLADDEIARIRQLTQETAARYYTSTA